MSASLEYKDASLALFSVKTPSIAIASSALLEMSAALKVSAAIAKVFPKEYPQRLRPLNTAFEEIRFPKKDGDGRQASVIISQLIDTNLCPLEEVWLNEEAMNFADDFTLHIEVQGFKMSMDDFGDLISGDPNDVPDHLGLHIMIGLLWGWYGDEREIQELWRMYSNRFNWDVPDYPKFPDDHYLDLKLLRRKLRKASLSSVLRLLLAIDGSTDNVFFDFDYECWQPIDLSISTLVSLHKDWQQALPLIDECHQAMDLLVKKPEFYKTFLGAYGSSLRPRTKNGAVT